MKNKVADKDIQLRIKEIIKETTTHTINLQTIERAWALKEKYKYGYWDSLILASALECGCSILYTEDLQDKQIIENLTIINPLKLTL